ncbi:MAG: M48 family metalloprotease [Halioglobus sp.]
MNTTRLAGIERRVPAFFGCFAALLISTLLTACATTVISPEMEGQLGSEMAQEVEEQIGLYVDPELEAYVKAVGLRLVAGLGATPYTFHFHIVDQSEPNAFATFGGWIYISRGLLTQMNSEAELAGVLAHEISHVTQRHHARQAGRNVSAGLFTLPGRAVGVVSENLGNAINRPIETVGQVYLSSYSRGQETEADEFGMALAAKAGYDPIALVNALESLEKSVEFLTGEQHEASFFDSHPTTPARVADIQSRAKQIEWAARPPIDSDEKLAYRMSGLWWGENNPQQGVFDEQVYLNASFNFRLAFADGWKTVNAPRYVAAAEPEGGAYIALGGADASRSVTEQADTLEAKMREQAQLEPAERRAISIDGWPAQLLRYDDNSSDETVSLYYLFVAIQDDSFTITAMGYERYREQLRQTVMSMRKLTTAEAKSIGGLRVRVATARSGESLDSLSRRVGNQWPVELTAIVNGLGVASDVEAGTPVKIAVWEQYSP